MKHDSHFIFEKLQFKSIDKLRLFAKLFWEMEVEFWVRVGKITLKNCFICPEITEEQIDSLNTTPEEKHIRDIIRQLR